MVIVIITFVTDDSAPQLSRMLSTKLTIFQKIKSHKKFQILIKICFETLRLYWDRTSCYLPEDSKKFERPKKSKNSKIDFWPCPS